MLKAGEINSLWEKSPTIDYPISSGDPWNHMHTITIIPIDSEGCIYIFRNRSTIKGNKNQGQREQMVLHGLERKKGKGENDITIF